MDGDDPLIAHSISVPTCTRRQREHYHKCYTCVHAAAGAATAPLVPRSVAGPQDEKPAPVTSPVTSDGAA